MDEIWLVHVIAANLLSGSWLVAGVARHEYMISIS